MPLRIGIIGGGIAGLSAAISLRRHGHEIHIFERSSFDNEVGAAIHVAPNASRIMQDWGFDIEELRPSVCEKVTLWSPEEEFLNVAVTTKDMQETLEIHDPWLLVHRVDLHQKLKEFSQRDGPTAKPTLHLRSAVKSADCNTGLITFEDGRLERFDLILGADGVHAVSVPGLTHEPREEISSGQNCYRFLVPTEKMTNNPVGRAFVEKIGLTTVASFGSHECSLVIYPCRHGDLLNCAALHSETLSAPADSTSSTVKRELESMFANWGPGIRKLCSLAEDAKLWPLTTRDPPNQFHNGKLLLIGDAAHPTLPHQGQGGAQAIEDASALGALFGPNVMPEQVEERGKLFNDVRYAHSVTVLFMSRKRDDKRVEMMPELKRFVPDAEFPESMFKYAWTSYPDKLAIEALSQIDVT